MKPKIYFEIEERGKLAVSEELQKLVLDCHIYFCQSNGTQYVAKNKTAKALKIPLIRTERIVEREKVMKNGRGKYQRKVEGNIHSFIHSFD